MKNIIEFREFINKVKNFNLITEENQYDKLIFFDKNIVDTICDINFEIKNLLNDSSFDDENVYFKGGVARLALITYIENKNINEPIRDIDLVYINENINNYFNFRDSDIEKYYDVEYIENFDKYFKSRDITLNEVLLRPDKLICTRRAYRDVLNYSINPKSNDISSRMFSRMLLFAARYNYNISKNIEMTNNIYPFDFLVCLLKAYELGIESDYFYICKDYNVTDEYDLKDWLFYLLNNVFNFNLFGRDKLIVKDLKDFTSEKLNTLYEYYPSLKDEVDKINLDYDEDYSNFLTKPNRNKINKNKHFF